MADHRGVTYAVAEGNDYAEHEATYRGFLRLAKWGTAITVTILVLMALFLT